MVKHFSVDWLAKSHHDTPKSNHGPVDKMATQRPHVPCLVQPRPPTCYDKDYLKPKPKTQRTLERLDSAENDYVRESILISPVQCSSPISELSGYSSGYESEAASSECLSVDEGTEGDRDVAQRRMRTKFTPAQIQKLEKIFHKHKYLDAGERVKTAHKLNLSETQVRTWFQNRRMKLKREVQDLRTEYFTPTFSPVMLQHGPVGQYHGFVVQRPQYYAANPALYAAVIPQVSIQQQQMVPHSSYLHSCLY